MFQDKHLEEKMWVLYPFHTDFEAIMSIIMDSGKKIVYLWANQPSKPVICWHNSTIK